MFTTPDEHIHDQKRNCGIKDATKAEIKELFKLKIKPKRMLEIIEEKGLPTATKRQLSNYLKTLREQVYSSSSISLGELEAWCKAHSNKQAFIKNKSQ